MTAAVIRAAVIGAGPMGLAAALGALRRGFDVTVFEKGRVGEAMRRWGETRLFTPLAMNVGPEAREILGAGCPSDDALLTGPEMADRVLAPLALSLPLRGRVRENTAVAAVGRSGLTRSDHAGHPIRSEKPFRILIDTPAGEEAHEAEIVLDASGGFAIPNFTGRGGVPAVGERVLGDRVVRSLGALSARTAELAGRSILLVGHGHSAAAAMLALAAIAKKTPSTRILWAFRSGNRRPCQEVARDPLPERQRVSAAANDLASSPPPFLSIRRRTSILSMAARGDGARVHFDDGGEAPADFIVSLTGYSPDFSFLSELALDISPATQGTRRLAAALAGVTDCLSVPSVGREDFESGEPGFFFVGSKSYGRSRSFLMKTGLAHLETILNCL